MTPLPEPVLASGTRPAIGGLLPPGCQVRGCCCGIPFGCGSVLLLAGLALSGVLTVQSVQHSVQKTQAQQQAQQRDRTEIQAPADVRQGANE